MTAPKEMEKKSKGQTSKLPDTTCVSVSPKVKNRGVKVVLQNIGHTETQSGSSNVLIKLRYFKCSTCNLTFTSEADIIAHVKTHRVRKNVQNHATSNYAELRGLNTDDVKEIKAGINCPSVDEEGSGEVDFLKKRQFAEKEQGEQRTKQQTTQQGVGIKQVKNNAIRSNSTSLVEERSGLRAKDDKTHLTPRQTSAAQTQCVRAHHLINQIPPPDKQTTKPEPVTVSSDDPVEPSRVQCKRKLRTSPCRSKKLHVRNVPPRIVRPLLPKSITQKLAIPPDTSANKTTSYNLLNTCGSNHLKPNKLCLDDAERERKDRVSQVASADELQGECLESLDSTTTTGDDRTGEASTFPTTSFSKPTLSANRAAVDHIDYRCGICGFIFGVAKPHLNSLVVKHFWVEHIIKCPGSTTKEDHLVGTHPSSLGLIELYSKGTKKCKKEITRTSYLLPEFDDLSNFLARLPSSVQSTGTEAVAETYGISTPKTSNTSSSQDAVSTATNNSAGIVFKDRSLEDITSTSGNDISSNNGSMGSNTVNTDWSRNSVPASYDSVRNQATSAPRYVCSICGTQFVSRGTCILHIKTVHKRTPLLPRSNQPMVHHEMNMSRLLTADGVLGRRSKKENTSEGQRFICSLCGNSFASLKRCNKHMQKKHIQKVGSRKGRNKSRQKNKNSRNQGKRDALSAITKVRSEQHDTDVTTDSLLKLTQCMLAVRYSDEEEEVEDGVIEDEDELNECKKFTKSDDKVILKYRCSVCPEEFPSIKDCGKHMICEHVKKDKQEGCSDAMMLGMYTIPLRKLDANSGVVSCSKQDSVGEYINERRKQVSVAMNDERKQECLAEVVKEKVEHGEAQQQENDRQQDIDDESEQLRSDFLKQRNQRTRRAYFDAVNARNRRRRAEEREKKQQEMLEQETPEERHAREHDEEQKQLRKEKCRLSRMLYPCTECFEVFRGSEKLNNHISLKHCGVSSLRCRRCVPHAKDADDAKYRALVQEVTTVRGKILEKGQTTKGAYQMEQYFECGICGEAFGKKQHLQRHVAHHPDLVCRICQQIFSSQQPLHAHIHTHNCGPLMCGECGQTFYSTNRLLTHLIGHAEKLQCGICHVSFSHKGNLKRHMMKMHQVGEKVRQYKCSECDQKFFCRNTYKNHVESTHRSKDTSEAPIHMCETCGAQFKKARGLRIHTVSKHKEIFTCKQGCGSWFLEQSQLALHQKRVHQNTSITTSTLSNPWKRTMVDSKCCYCEKPFGRRSLLIKHEMRHEGLAYRCDQCDILSPSFEDHTKHHRKAHRQASSWKYRCDICKKLFATPLVTKHHRETHRTCPLCRKTFANADLLKSHLREHRDHLKAPRDPANLCHICGKQCFNLGELTLHQLRSHKGSPTLQPSVWSVSMSANVSDGRSAPTEDKTCLEEGEEAVRLLAALVE